MKKEFEIGDLVCLKLCPENVGIVKGFINKTAPIKYTAYEIEWLTNPMKSTPPTQHIYLQKVEVNNE